MHEFPMLLATLVRNDDDKHRNALYSVLPWLNFAVRFTVTSLQLGSKYPEAVKQSWRIWVFQSHESTSTNYRQASNISHSSVGNTIIDHADVVGASPVGAAPTTSPVLYLTPGFNGLGKYNCKSRRSTCKFLDLVRLILEVWRCITTRKQNIETPCMLFVRTLCVRRSLIKMILRRCLQNSLSTFDSHKTRL